ncbi:type IV secretory system conjugative DNA transfer family protein [Streptomyces sp. MMS24-I2-30]|uniref:type IV secretory system conjugative DNA transfer family protein n=1 Tax=Streptomyces sp. MMS24-I2-30 TaxID=3351564 RepID=UPI00389697E7
MSAKSSPDGKNTGGKGSSDNRAALAILGLCGAGWAYTMWPSALDALEGVDWPQVAAWGGVGVMGSAVAAAAVRVPVRRHRAAGEAQSAGEPVGRLSAAREAQAAEEQPEALRAETVWRGGEEDAEDALGAGSAWEAEPQSPVPAGSWGAAEPVPAVLTPEPDQTAGPELDEAPRLIAALKLDYPSGKPRTVSRYSVDLGTEWVIELPPGGVYGDVASKPDVVASWVGVPLERLTLRPVDGDLRRVVILVLNEEIYSRVPALPDPVEAAGRGVIPVGYDMHGHITEIPSPVGDTHVLIAGSTGGGKTEEMKWLAFFALVNGWDLVLVDGKGDGDFAYLAKACLIYAEVPGHDEMMDIISRVEDEHMKRASANSASVAKGEGKLAHKPLLFLIDEVSTYTDEADTAKQKNEFEAKLKVASRKFRSSQILVVLSTQNPKAEVINTSIRGNHRVRIALGCADSSQSDVILNKGTAKSGFDASKLPEVAGAAILQVKDRNREMRGFMVGDEEINAAVDARMSHVQENEDDATRMVRQAYGEDTFLSTIEFAERLRSLGVVIPEGDARTVGAAVTEWLADNGLNASPAPREAGVRGRHLDAVLRP